MLRSLTFFTFIIIIISSISHSSEQDRHESSQIQTIVKQFAQPIKQWIGFNRSAIEVAKECQLEELQSDLLNFHTELAESGEDFTRQHIDVIRNTFKQNSKIKNFFKCIVQKSNTDNDFVKEQKKYKYLSQFIKQHSHVASQTFYVDDKPIDKGYRLGRFFMAFFEYYYQYVLHPAETASTKLIRAMTTKTQLFWHEDISPCLSFDTSGKISQNLENIGIYNIYINVPEAFNAIKYMTFKDIQKCKTPKYKQMLSNIHQTLQKIDMFKIMYHEFNPWVEIAAEKYGNKQIQYIARIFAKIANNQQHYQEISSKSEDDL